MKLDTRVDPMAAASTIGGRTEATASGVTWSAIFAGAIAALAATLILLAIGSGLGLATASPWPNAGASAASIGIGAGIWLVVMQWLSSALGGYLTGRLRTRWVGLRTDEVVFRDTAHGFLAWALATALAFAVASMAATSAVSGAASAVTSVAAGAAQGAAQGATQVAGNQPGVVGDVAGYFTDMLFRAGTGAAAAGTPGGQTDVRAEAGRILMRGIAAGELSAADRAYLAQLVAAQTGIDPAAAQARVDEVIRQVEAAQVQVREAADTALTAGATASFLLAVSLLIGALAAAGAAVLGGRQRDDFETVVSR